MAAKRPKRRRFLILRCRLFLPLRSRIRQASDCSPANRQRELGLDRHETGSESRSVREELRPQTIGARARSTGRWCEATIRRITAERLQAGIRAEVSAALHRKATSWHSPTRENR